MSRVIFDIETAGAELDSFEPEVQQYLLKLANTEEEIQLVKESLSFYPNTAEIVAIGMLNPDTGKGVVYFQSGNDADAAPFEEDGITYRGGSERAVIQGFWDVIKKYDKFVTFNGRAFDCPFIMIRSAVHDIRPTRDLMPNRFGSEHIDLLDRLTFYGATRRRFSLDMWCRTFGIKSPKSEGVTGYDVKDMFRAGRYKEIAVYCARDLWATRELLFKWEGYIKYPPEGQIKVSQMKS
ncbi:ribonuclease H-like domain-containing protein [Candidatus Magnetobacterium casense]|uniref:Ribonuclease H-like domain-containing protein n=1 Tax=Candidatus Magnetobacterium casense TaxID=1455061 RepID=A0ABS6RYQ2_9BACT|nr:ribonuclease H-like domain-containing protein [Candidatus Magnetobacterium casensis]MBV6341774.1 ribonuclease H-like domain-containing protein [Candidatus Magnetobacterium casensis]